MSVDLSVPLSLIWRHCYNRRPFPFKFLFLFSFSFSFSFSFFSFSFSFSFSLFSPCSLNKTEKNTHKESMM